MTVHSFNIQYNTEPFW